MDNVTDWRPPADLDRTEGNKEWIAVTAETAEDVRHCVARVGEAGAADLADIFYATLMGETGHGSDELPPCAYVAVQHFGR